MLTDGELLTRWLDEKIKSTQELRDGISSATTTARLNGAEQAFKMVKDNLKGFAPATPPARPLENVPTRTRARSRLGDPDTSRRAAGLLPEGANDLHRHIYRALSRQAMTDDDLRLALGSLSYEKTSYTKRRGELVEAGYVRDSGVRVISDKGRSMTVWQIVP